MSVCPSQANEMVHLVVADALGRHEPQVFRMRVGQRLRCLVKTYGAFLKKRLGLEAEFQMSTPAHGILDPQSSAASYAFTDGEEVTFTELNSEDDIVDPTMPVFNAGDEEDARGLNLHGEEEEDANEYGDAADGDHVAVGERESTASHAVRSGAFAEASGGADHAEACEDAGPSDVADAYDAAECAEDEAISAALRASAVRSGKSGKRGRHPVRAGRGADDDDPLPEGYSQTIIWANIHAAALPENMAPDPEVPRGCKVSVTAQGGPAKGWRIIAYWSADARGKAQPPPGRGAIRWRVSSPGRKRTFDTFRSTRGTPNLRDAVPGEVFTQIFYQERTKALATVSEKRQQDKERVTPEKEKRAEPDVQEIGKKRALTASAPARSVRASMSPLFMDMETPPSMNSTALGSPRKSWARSLGPSDVPV